MYSSSSPGIILPAALDARFVLCTDRRFRMPLDQFGDPLEIRRADQTVLFNAFLEENQSRYALNAVAADQRGVVVDVDLEKRGLSRMPRGGGVEDRRHP